MLFVYYFLVAFVSLFVALLCYTYVCNTVAAALSHALSYAWVSFQVVFIWFSLSDFPYALCECFPIFECVCKYVLGF